MKRNTVSKVVVLAVLAVVVVSFGQAPEQADRRQAMRERIRNMSQEERAKFVERMRGIGLARPYVSREDQEKAIKVIEEQLAKFKAVVQAQGRPQGRFQDLSEEERAKLIQNFTDRRIALQAIVDQVALLQGRRPLEEEDALFIIINTADLKPIQEMAKKEKATETSELLAMIAEAPFDSSPFSRGARSGQGGQRGGTGQQQ